jgi:hypothetical protein
MKKIITYFPIMYLIFLFSCQTENMMEPISENGKLELSISAEKLSKMLKKTTTGSITNVVVDIEDGTGQSIYSNEIIPLININGEYISEPISLETGNYNLTKFLVTDETNTVLYATPLKGSKTAYLVNNPLEIEFNLAKDETKKIVMEVINTSGLTASDFGYTTFSFDIVETINFLISVFVYNDTTANLEQTSAVIAVSGDSSLIYSDTLAAETNSIVVKDGYASYNVVVNKDGYSEYSQMFTDVELQSHFVDPIEVVLNPEEIDEYTKLLIKGDGIEGQTVFTDNSPTQKTINTYGNTVVDITNKVVGSGSISFDGTGDYLRLDDSADWDFETGNFTIDFWIFVTGNTVAGGIVGSYHDASHGWRVVMRSDSKIDLNVLPGGYYQALEIENGTSLLNQWHHVAIVRNGNDLLGFVDGELKATSTITVSINSSYITYTGLLVGSNSLDQPDSWTFQGNIDELRISKGIARWTSNFTP